MHWGSPFKRRCFVSIAVIASVFSATGVCLAENQRSEAGKRPAYSANAKAAPRTSGVDADAAAVGRQKLSIDTTSPAVTATVPPDAPDLVPETDAKITDVTANAALAQFFKALAGLGKGGGAKQVTVLHLGDSHIAADRFSGDLREEMQIRFGNGGRGMLMPGLYLARGIKFEQGGDWQVALAPGGANGPYSITGAKVWANSRNAWMRLTATDESFTWAEITMETGPQSGSAFVSADGEMLRLTTAEPSPSWKTVRLAKSAREILIKPEGDGPVTLHSFMIGTDKPGVRYISLGLPGATATTPLAWHPGQLVADMKRLTPDLIVFAYGTEESLNDDLDVADYEAKVNTALVQIRQAAPQASLLVIGPPDVAHMPPYAINTGKASDVCRALGPKERADYARLLRKKDPKIAYWHAPLQLDAVRLVLRRAAAANNAYFWDWSKVMGGSCGVHAWVHSEPPLAAADHTHLTEEGSKRSARLFFRELMTAFEGFSYTASTAAKR